MNKLMEFEVHHLRNIVINRDNMPKITLSQEYSLVTLDKCMSILNTEFLSIVRECNSNLKIGFSCDQRPTDIFFEDFSFIKIDDWLDGIDMYNSGGYTLKFEQQLIKGFELNSDVDLQTFNFTVVGQCLVNLVKRCKLQQEYSTLITNIKRKNHE
jgi:hypothetical protein